MFERQSLAQHPAIITKSHACRGLQIGSTRIRKRLSARYVTGDNFGYFGTLSPPDLGGGGGTQQRAKYAVSINNLYENKQKDQTLISFGGHPKLTNLQF